MCKVCAQIDRARADAFAGQLIGLLNQGALSLMVSVGHRTGLFDTLGDCGEVTASELASAAGLNERYVREWLGAMVTGRIVEFDPATGCYHLPAEHAAFLTRSAGADNIAVFAQYIPVLGSVEDRIVDCFRHGGGVPYDEYRRFHEVMAEDSGQSVLSALLEKTLPLVPGITGQLQAGIEVLDIGCGSGRALIRMAAAFPKSRFLGVDLCAEPIVRARQEAASAGLYNIRFEQRDLTTSRPERRYHLVTAFDAIHDQARPDRVLSLVYESLLPGGWFLMQDIDGSSQVENNLDHPIGPLLYTISCMHCMTVSLAQDGMGLGAMWGTEKALEMLRLAGFTQVDVHRLDHDFQNCYYVTRKS